jgi:hypothetical protein
MELTKKKNTLVAKINLKNIELEELYVSQNAKSALFALHNQRKMML